MGLFQRLFGAVHDAITLPRIDGSQAVNISAAMLRECIDRGSDGPDGPHRARLTKPFARGYLFGFSDACIQSFGVFDELESLALITAVHGTLFGQKIGSRLVHDALRDQRDAEFARGRAAGDADHFRWLNDRSNTPRSLTDYLLKGANMSSLLAATVESAADSSIDTTDIPRYWSSTGNAALIPKNATMAAAPDGSATTIWLRKRLHMKAVKPISHR